MASSRPNLARQTLTVLNSYVMMTAVMTMMIITMIIPASRTSASKFTRRASVETGWTRIRERTTTTSRRCKANHRGVQLINTVTPTPAHLLLQLLLLLLLLVCQRNGTTSSAVDVGHHHLDGNSAETYVLPY